METTSEQKVFWWCHQSIWRHNPAFYVYQLHIFLEDRIFFGSWISYQNLRKMFWGIIKLGWLLGAFKAQLTKWRKNDKGPSMGSRIKRFEYRKFPLSGKWNCTQFCKITTGHGNTIKNWQIWWYFCLYGILFLYMPKHGLFLLQKILFNYLVAPFYLVLTMSCSHYRLGSGTSLRKCIG